MTSLVRLVVSSIVVVHARRRREAELFEADVLNLANCSCVQEYGGAPLSRLYHFDTGGELYAGFNHQFSNLRAVLAEGLSLGRAVLLRQPKLTRHHNHEKRFEYNRWKHYVSFEKSTFQLVGAATGRRKALRCNGTLASCIADVSYDQMKGVRKGPTAKFFYQAGRVPVDMNQQTGLLMRTSGPHHGDKKDRVSLTRKLPGFNDIISENRLTLTLRPSDDITNPIPPVLAYLRRKSKTGTIAVVHARRGDKLEKAGYCPDQMRTATSPQHIASTLKAANVRPGSAVYVMSNEPDPEHFLPLQTTYGYKLATSANFKHLSDLLKGCDGDVPEDGQCENYFLFAIENEIMRRVPRRFRIPTLPKPDMPHSVQFLMKDFLDKGKCKLR